VSVSGFTCTAAGTARHGRVAPQGGPTQHALEV